MRNQKILDLMFNEAAAPGEVISCVERLRPAYKSGALFSKDNTDEQEIKRLRYALDNSRVAMHNAQEYAGKLERELKEERRKYKQMELDFNKAMDMAVEKVKEAHTKQKGMFTVSEVSCLAFVAVALGIILALIFAPGPNVSKLEKQVQQSARTIKEQQQTIKDLKELTKLQQNRLNKINGGKR